MKKTYRVRGESGFYINNGFTDVFDTIEQAQEVLRYAVDKKYAELSYTIELNIKVVEDLYHVPSTLTIGQLEEMGILPTVN